MTHSLRHLTWMAMVAAAVVIPTFAHGAPERAPGNIQAFDLGFRNPQTDENTVTINVGEIVTFSYPEGGNFHNVNFIDNPPTSCTQTAGPNSGPVPPLPRDPSGVGWAGTCQFNT